MIKVLHVVSDLGSGGVESLLYSYYKKMNKNKIQFEFITHRPTGLFGEKFLSLDNCKIHHISFRRNHPIKSAIEAYKIFKSSDCDIVHFHGNKEVGLQLFAAYLTRKKIRIIHSHNPILRISRRKLIIDGLTKYYLSVFATDFIASSQLVIESSFRKEMQSNKKPIVMNNAIEAKKYIFSDNKRNVKRDELGIRNKFVIGNIGRFTYQKNHIFLIDVFLKVYEKNKNATLLLIGEGEDEDKVKSRIKELGLEHVIKLLGIRTDIPDLMQAMDVFLFPSNYEGLGIVLVEAQASALKCIASDKVIPKETNITDFIEYISLKESSEYWAEKVLQYSEGYERINTYDQIKLAGYDIENQSKWLENYYNKRSCNCKT